MNLNLLKVTDSLYLNPDSIISISRHRNYTTFDELKITLRNGPVIQLYHGAAKEAADKLVGAGWIDWEPTND